MNPEDFVRELSELKFDNAFNPYSDRCPVYDSDDSPVIRRDALLSILSAAVQSDIDSIWVGRDLGYRGGRRTGFALTDEVYLHYLASRWGVRIGRPVSGPIFAERTSAVIWEILCRIDVPIFLWNIFPLHPYNPGMPFSNRLHNADERRAGEEFLKNLVEMLGPKKVVAIGKDAGASVCRTISGPKIFQVRHPSYGGQTVFLENIHKLYRVRSKYVPRPVDHLIWFEQKHLFPNK